MPLIDKLQAGSFKGVGFLIKGSDTSAGRKTVPHEYPNSDRRFVEDLGKVQKTFSINAIITSNSDNYLQARDALIDALESQGSGLLVHPFYGDHTVAATKYTVNESTSRLNEAAFSITFMKTDENIFPKEGGSNLSKINSIRGETLSSIESDVGSIFAVDRLSSVNFSDAQGLLTGVTNSFTGNLDKVTNDSSKISQFATIASSFQNNINSNILDPSSLGIDFIGLFTGANSTAASALDQFNLFRLFSNFGDNDTEILPTTVARIQRKQNRDVINTSTQIGALTQGYAAASQRTYSDNRELLEARDVLETQYQKVIGSDLQKQSGTRLKLTELRNEARVFFEKEAVSVPKLLDVNTRKQPLTVLAYNYYGNVDNVQSLDSLNMFDNPTFVEGDVTILTGIT